MSDSQNERKQRPKQTSSIRIPLIEPIRTMIHRECGEKSEVVVDILEGVVPTLSPDNMYGELVSALTPVVDQKAKGLVGRILAYKKKPCRSGDSCRNRNCIFLHDRDRRNVSRHAARHEECEGHDASSRDPSKRRKTGECGGNSEVIFNKVDESRHSPDDLRDYAGRFGNVVNLRRLNAEKYLVVFETHECADRLVKSQEPVLGDEGIKKFYNVMENLVKVEFRKLFEEQEAIVEKMSTDLSLNLLDQLKNVNFKIKSLVMRDRKEAASTGDRRDFDQEQSLYCNSF